MGISSCVLAGQALVWCGFRAGSGVIFSPTSFSSAGLWAGQLSAPTSPKTQHGLVCGPQPGCTELPQRFFEPVTNATFGWAWGCQGTREGQRETCSLLFQLRPSAGVKRGVSRLGRGDAFVGCSSCHNPTQGQASLAQQSQNPTRQVSGDAGAGQQWNPLLTPRNPPERGPGGPRAVQPARGRPWHPNNVTLRRAAAQAPRAAPGTHSRAAAPQPHPAARTGTPGVVITGEADGAGTPRLVMSWPSPGGRH